MPKISSKKTDDPGRTTRLLGDRREVDAAFNHRGGSVSLSQEAGFLSVSYRDMLIILTTRVKWGKCDWMTGVFQPHDWVVGAGLMDRVASQNGRVTDAGHCLLIKFRVAHH